MRLDRVEILCVPRQPASGLVRWDNDPLIADPLRKLPRGLRVETEFTCNPARALHGKVYVDVLSTCGEPGAHAGQDAWRHGDEYGPCPCLTEVAGRQVARPRLS